LKTVKNAYLQIADIAGCHCLLSVVSSALRTPSHDTNNAQNTTYIILTIAHTTGHP